jgi:ketosteroid isomerase-like protein
MNVVFLEGGTMNSARFALVILTPGLVFGCATPPARPAVDIEAEKAVIEQLLDDQLAGTNQAGEAGADGYVSIATDELVLLPPNATRIDGRQAVRDWSLQFTSAEGWSVSWKPTQVEVAASGDLAYAIGTYELSLTDADGNAVADEGKFLNMFEKQADGEWRLTIISYSSDLPVAGAPVSEE